MSVERQSSQEDAKTLDIHAPGARKDTPAEFVRGTSVDRYVILDPLGNGGMGSVYSAYDPQLDRKVALKFLHRWLPKEGVEGTEDITARLMREAQAMGRLSHPNVVGVYDIGVSADGRVFLAMEIVEGGTLVAWLKEQKPGWRDVVRVFCEAGEGLAAAHRAGIIHRDFKLDNVLMGADGRPRVTDFGVARAANSPTDRPRRDAPRNGKVPRESPSLGSLTGVSLSSRLTLTGTMLGTPGYMAPEQYDDSDIDARADVFAFSATLYRALYGERPFAGDSIADIAAATMMGRVRPPPKGSAVPTWLHRVLLRGMAPERDARPGTMRELLASLRADPARRRRRWLAAGAIAAAACVAALGVHETGRRRVHACRAMAEQVGGAWNDPRKASIERAFRSTGLPYASGTWDRVERELDRYAASWSGEVEQACAATRIRHERSESALELQLACLDDRLDELRALSDTLATADDGTVENAVQAVDALSPVAPCANLDRLSASSRLPDDPVARAEIRALRGEVAAAKALGDSGKEVQSLERLRKIAHRVEATAYGPLVVSWTLGSARAEAAADPRVAVADFSRAALLADANRLDPQRAEALIELGNEAHVLTQFEESHRWTLQATAAIERMGGDPALEVRRDVREGWTYGCEEKYPEAATLFTRALERARAAHLEDPALIASAHSGLADTFAVDDRYDEALEHMRIALHTVEEAYGPQHPAVAEELDNLATTLLDADRLEEALASASRAVAIFDAAARRGDISSNAGRVGDAARTKGEVLLRLGRAGEAAEQLSRALAIFHASGEKHDLVALADNQLAEAHLALGDARAAVALVNDATDVEARVKNIPAETIAGTLGVRAKLAAASGNAAEAARLESQAHALFEPPPPKR